MEWSLAKATAFCFDRKIPTKKQHCEILVGDEKIMEWSLAKATAFCFDRKLPTKKQRSEILVGDEKIMEWSLAKATAFCFDHVFIFDWGMKGFRQGI